MIHLFPSHASVAPVVGGASLRAAWPSRLTLTLAVIALMMGGVGCKGRGSDAGEGTTPDGEEEDVLTSMEDRVRCESVAPVTRGIDVNNDGWDDLLIGNGMVTSADDPDDL